MLGGMFSVINLDPFLNSYRAYWHFSGLTVPLDEVCSSG
jgi:hypothetical protein